MVLPILLALANLAPAILPLFTGDKTANKAAGIVGDIASAVTGASTHGDALQALQNDPALLVEYQRQMSEATISLYQEETKRLEAINETYREEIKSDDPFVRRMRPFAGYVITLSVAALVAAVVKTIWVSPLAAPAVVGAAINMTPILAPALAVVGVYVYRRSSEKMAGVANMKNGFEAAARAIKAKFP